MKIYYLNDGLATAIVHSSLTSEEVVVQVNEAARKNYPSDIKPDFKIIMANEVREGFIALLAEPLSNKQWWDSHKKINGF